MFKAWTVPLLCGLLALGASLALAGGGRNAQAQEPTAMATISASGLGQVPVAVAESSAVLDLTLSGNGLSAARRELAALQSAVGARSAALLDAQPTQTGARLRASLVVPSPRLNSSLKLLQATEGVHVTSVNMRTEVTKQIEGEAVAAAMQDAKQAAELAAKALGQTLGPVTALKVSHGQLEPQKATDGPKTGEPLLYQVRVWAVFGGRSS